MILISKNADAILQTYRNDYVDYKTHQEYGRSAFWNWYDQICSNIYALDREDLHDGQSLVFSMDYWGEIIYSKITLSNRDYIVVIEDFKFNLENFYRWLRHLPLISAGHYTAPSFSTPIPNGWHLSGTCSNGFAIIWTEDEFCHTIYNYAYKGNVVYVNNSGLPMQFTSVSDFKNGSASARFHKQKYVLYSNGRCIRIGNTDMFPHTERTLSKAEYNHYKNYGKGESRIRNGQIINEARIGQIIHETIRKILG